MDTLVKALSDFFAAILSKVGFIGRSRRRESIKEDLTLLDRLRESPDYGAASKAHRYLFDHITTEVAHYSGVRLKPGKKWNSICVAAVIGFPCAYITYATVQDGFAWQGVPTGVVAFVMIVGGLGLLFEGEEERATEEPPPTARA